MCSLVSPSSSSQISSNSYDLIHPITSLCSLSPSPSLSLYVQNRIMERPPPVNPRFKELQRDENEVNQQTIIHSLITHPLLSFDLIPPLIHSPSVIQGRGVKGISFVCCHDIHSKYSHTEMLLNTKHTRMPLSCSAAGIVDNYMSYFLFTLNPI